MSTPTKYRLLNLKTRTYMTVGIDGISVFGKNFEAKNQSQQWYINLGEAVVTIKSASKSNGQDKYLAVPVGNFRPGGDVNVKVSDTGKEGPVWNVSAAEEMRESMIIMPPDYDLYVEQTEFGGKTHLNEKAGIAIYSQIWIPVEATD